jgi:predicted regulator of Ras-like GTPase activity (Roadblock/LC7/MglB family)
MPADVPFLISPVEFSGMVSAAIAEAADAGEIRYLAVTRADGLLIAHNLSDAGMAKRLAAIAAALVGTARAAAAQLGGDEVHETIVRLDSGHLVCFPAGDQAIVAGMAKGEVNLGLVLLVLRKLAKKVGDAIAGV